MKTKALLVTALSITLLFSGFSFSNVNKENISPININTAEAATEHKEFVKYVTSNWAKVKYYNKDKFTFAADPKRYSKLAQYRTYKYNWIGWKVTTGTYYKVVYKK